MVIVILYAFSEHFISKAFILFLRILNSERVYGQNQHFGFFIQTVTVINRYNN